MRKSSHVARHCDVSALLVKKVRKAPPTIPKTMMQNANNLTALPITQILGEINHTMKATRAKTNKAPPG